MLCDCRESLFLHVIYFKSHTAGLHCCQLFLRREKKKLDAYWILQQHPPHNLQHAFCCKKSINDEGGQATWQVTTFVKIPGCNENPQTRLLQLLAPIVLLATIPSTCVHKEKLFRNPKLKQIEQMQTSDLILFQGGIKLPSYSEDQGAKQKSYIFSHLSSPPESPIKQDKSQAYCSDFMVTRWHRLPVN